MQLTHLTGHQGWVRSSARWNTAKTWSIAPCSLRANCQLKSLLGQALKAFYTTLDRYLLADAVASPTGEAIIALHRLRVAAL